MRRWFVAAAISFSIVRTSVSVWINGNPNRDSMEPLFGVNWHTKYRHRSASGGKAKYVEHPHDDSRRQTQSSNHLQSTILCTNPPIGRSETLRFLGEFPLSMLMAPSSAAAAHLRSRNELPPNLSYISELGSGASITTDAAVRSRNNFMSRLKRIEEKNEGVYGRFALTSDTRRVLLTTIRELCEASTSFTVAEQKLVDFQTTKR